MEFPAFMSPLEGGGVAPESFAAVPTQNVLPVAMTLQEETNWCWSAVTQAVLRFVHDREVSQEDIATRHMQRTGKPYDCALPRRKQMLKGSCGDTQCRGGCNDTHYLRIILAEQNCFHSILSQGAPTFTQLRDEIDSGRPVPCRIQWRPDGGHFVLVTGWMIGADGVARVRVLDPARNEGGNALIERTMAHTMFTKRYQGTLGFGWVNYSYRVQ